MKIVAFTGMPYSGKSEAVSVARDRGYPIVRMGDSVWTETRKQGLKLTDKNVGQIASEMRKLKGNDIWAKRTYEKIHEYNDSIILIIDGIRNDAEVRYFKENLSKEFVLVAILTVEDLRYKRAMLRRRIDDTSSFNKMRQRDKREMGWGIDKVINSAEVKITNNKGIEEFKSNINAFFDNLEKR
jgi:dephospho-CoA kinase